MPGYIPKAQKKFSHPTPKRPQHAPAKAKPIKYGVSDQVTDVDNSAPLSQAEIRDIQDIVGTLLYYGRAVDPTLAATLSSIAARQANGTEDVKAACHQLLDYCATHPNAGVRFTASDMILKIHSDASYLSELGSKSRVAGHFYLSTKGGNDTNNGAILTLSAIIKHVMTSATEAELAALFYNCKTAVPL